MQYTLISDDSINNLTQRVNELTEVGFKIDKAYSMTEIPPGQSFPVAMHYVWLVKE